MGFSFWELALIVLVGLLVLGPKQLAQLSQRLGRYWRQASQAMETAKDEFQRAANDVSADKPRHPEAGGDAQKKNNQDEK